MALLKLLALDEDDLKIISAHMQDALLRIEDMAFEPGAQRFVALMNRFDWTKADGNSYERRRCALRFDRVERVRLKNLRPGEKRAPLELLAIRFEAGEPPGGYVELIFAGDCAIRLDVEYIEAELKDLGPGWAARSKPDHEGQE